MGRRWTGSSFRAAAAAAQHYLRDAVEELPHGGGTWMVLVRPTAPGVEDGWEVLVRPAEKNR